jgi:5S rRNA maturation endonuclease (ribonuclease M5)
MQEIGHERMRDGAYAWNLFHDPDDKGRAIETWLVHSLLELRYRAERQTKADELMERRARALLSTPAESSYFVAAERPHHSWRSGRAGP